MAEQSPPLRVAAFMIQVPKFLAISAEPLVIKKILTLLRKSASGAAPQTDSLPWAHTAESRNIR